MDFTTPVYMVACFMLYPLRNLITAKTHGDDQLYDWKDLAASGFMAWFGYYRPMIRWYRDCNIESTYELFKPGDRMGIEANILVIAPFGIRLYIWFLCQLADDFTILLVAQSQS